MTSPQAANNVPFEKVFGSKAPLATPFNTCRGVVLFLMYACMQAAVISNAPAIRPAVNALAKNDFLIKVLWFVYQIINPRHLLPGP